MTRGFAGRTRSAFQSDHKLKAGTVIKCLNVLAVTILNYDREWRRRLEMSTFINDSLQPIQYLDVDAADETPMPVCTTDRLPNEGRVLPQT